MEQGEKRPESSLLKILGVGFGVAVCVGGTIGVGILRTPGPVAESLGSFWMIMLVWSLGGVYCLLGANYLAELASMIPKAGGFYVYAERAYGRYGGFVVGWSDWLYNMLGLSFIAVVFGEYAAMLLTPDLAGSRIFFSVTILIILGVLNWFGLRAGSETQKATSVVKAVALIAFVIVCFIYGGNADPASILPAASSASQTSFAAFVAFILAFQLVLATYDGWHCAIYFAEEDKNPGKNLPRSIFLGIFAIIVIYLLINFALLYVMPASNLAASKFAVGDAMSLIFGERSGQMVTILALLSITGIINALLMLNPRILLALGRDGLFTRRAAQVNKGGTPVFALAVTVVSSVVLSSVGSFELLLAISQFFAVTITILLVISLFVLRRKEAGLERPFRAKGYPFAPFLMLIFAVLLFFGYLVGNPYPSGYALLVLAASYPVFRLIGKN